jgi:hypothetical protein
VYRNRQKLRPSINLNRIRYTTYNTHSGLINGRGRFWKTDKTNNGAPLEMFKLTRGQKYLFRITYSSIATGGDFFLIIKAPNSPLSLWWPICEWYQNVPAGVALNMYVNICINKWAWSVLDNRQDKQWCSTRNV